MLVKQRLWQLAVATLVPGEEPYFCTAVHTGAALQVTPYTYAYIVEAGDVVTDLAEGDPSWGVCALDLGIRFVGEGVTPSNVCSNPSAPTLEGLSVPLRDESG